MAKENYDHKQNKVLERNSARTTSVNLTNSLLLHRGWSAPITAIALVYIIKNPIKI